MKYTMERKIDLGYLLFLGATAALGGLLFGFDIAIITGAGPFLTHHFRLNDLSLGWALSEQYSRHGDGGPGADAVDRQRRGGPFFPICVQPDRQGPDVRVSGGDGSRANGSYPAVGSGDEEQDSRRDREGLGGRHLKHDGGVLC